ncbi:DUF177 domain-containing protein [Ostreiculturibacter nitratireducens]|uniref:YceD family protein n=1 Tax=Ostreiculturibacter nitratireducens TaxID=3075226 RepID=UPI0031B5C637
MSPGTPYTHPIRTSELSGRKPQRFSLSPGADARQTIAAELGIDAVRKLTFTGELRPMGRHDWVLEADLGATVVQPCVVTLAPVTTRIDDRVTRRYLSEMPEPTGDEVEMPEDETSEQLPAVIDLGEVMVEALALALPLYPRAEGAELSQTEAAPPGAEPIDESARRPFAGLADLMKKQRDED